MLCNRCLSLGLGAARTIIKMQDDEAAAVALAVAAAANHKLHFFNLVFR